jgi:tetratricopeptide (TPR) repeat protein
MRLLSAGVFVCLSLARGAAAGEAEWQALMKQAATARQADKPADAVKPLTTAVTEAESFPPADPRLVMTLAALADTHDKLGHFTDAEPLYARAIAIVEKVAGPDHPVIGELLGKRADDLRKMGKTVEADQAAARAAKIAAAQAERNAKDAAGPKYQDMTVGQWTAALASPERMQVMDALLKGDKEALPVLVELLKSEPAPVRVTAANGLAQLGADAGAALPGLIAALKDKDLNVRYWALSAIKKMGPAASTAVPALIVALSTHPATEPGLEGPPRYYKDARSMAADALGSIGPGAKAAMPRLRELAAKDDEPEVRAAAASALALIDKK